MEFSPPNYTKPNFTVQRQCDSVNIFPHCLSHLHRAELLNARLHLMIRLEVPARVRHELAIGGMVDPLHTHNLGAERRHMTFDMLDELRLGVCGSRNEHGCRIGDGLSYALKEILISAAWPLPMLLAL